MASEKALALTAGSSDLFLVNRASLLLTIVGGTAAAVKMFAFGIVLASILIQGHPCVEIVEASGATCAPDVPTTPTPNPPGNNPPHSGRMLSENPNEVNGCDVCAARWANTTLFVPSILLFFVFIIAFIAPELISGARLICIGYPLAGVIRVVTCAIAVATCMIYCMNYARYGYEIIMNSVSALLIMALDEKAFDFVSAAFPHAVSKATSDGGAIKNAHLNDQGVPVAKV